MERKCKLKQNKTEENNQPQKEVLEIRTKVLPVVKDARSPRTV